MKIPFCDLHLTLTQKPVATMCYDAAIKARDDAKRITASRMRAECSSAVAAAEEKARMQTRAIVTQIINNLCDQNVRLAGQLSPSEAQKRLGKHATPKTR